MWGNVFRDAGKFGIFLDDALDRAGSETAEVAGCVDGLLVFTVVEEERGEGIGAGV